MKKFIFGLVLVAQMAFTKVSFGQVYAISSGGSGSGAYSTLKEAFSDINDGILAGSIDITITGSIVEPDSATLLSSGVGAASYTSVNIVPSGGAWTISGNVNGPLINLYGADNVTFDGLNANGNALTIVNTSTSSFNGTSTIRMMNDATGNTIRNCTLLGSSTTATTADGMGAVVFFGTASVTGNDNNTISHCDIGSFGGNTPTKAIASIGSSVNSTVLNSGISILNNTIHDYFATGASNAGIYLGNGNLDWTIDGNRFYQTVSRSQTAGTHVAIQVAGATNVSNSNLQILNNTIGYNAPDGTGTYTYSGSAGCQFIGINVASAGTATPASIQGNIISHIAIGGSASGTSGTAPFIGMSLTSGVVNVGTIEPNTIGSMNSTGAITVSSSSTSTSEYIGIYVSINGSTHTVSNNLIGGISASNTSTGSVNLIGIKVGNATAATLNINGNTIGGAITNSLFANSTASGTFVAGIVNIGSSSTISGNTLSNLTAAGGTGSSGSASVQGISVTSSSGHTIAHNIIFGLTNTHTTASTQLSGVYVNGSAGSLFSVDGNLVHSFNSASSSSTLLGVLVGTGATTCSNNMIRLGIDTAGVSITRGMAINGIYEVSGTNQFYHNSVYVGGTGVLGATNTFALNSIVVTGNRNYFNNILMNVRSNATGTGKHYAVKVSGPATNPTGLSMRNNLFWIDSTANSGGVIGLFNNVNYSTLLAWQTAVGGNAGSGFGDPHFVMPTGSASTVDLHIDASVPSPVEGAGIVVAAVTKDFDDVLRSTSTPDIGADEGTFTALDIYAPVITYTKLLNDASLTLRTEMDFATVTDYSGVNTTTGTNPRFYYKKSTNANTYVGNTANDNGWKYVEANSTGSPFSFDIDYGKIYGGVHPSDSIQYFVIVEDLATTPNIALNSGVLTKSPTSVDLQPVNFPITGTVNSFVIINTPMNGQYFVGASGDFSSLTAAASELLTRGVNGPVTLTLTDANYTSATETFPIVFGAINGVSSLNTIYLQPSVANTKIVGTHATAIIDLNGARYVTIDGRIDSTISMSQDLSIENTSTSSSSTIRFINDASNNTVQYVIVKGASTSATSGVVFFGSTNGTTGNDNNTIDHCQIKNGVSRPIQGINAIGNSSNAVLYNDNNIISNNNVFNYFHATTASAGIKVNGGNAGWIIEGNSLFDTAGLSFTSSAVHRAIYVNATAIVTPNASGFVVRNNVIGGTAPNATGNPLTIVSTGTSTGNSYTSIEVSVGNDAASLVQNNTIANIQFTGASSSIQAFQGINIERGVVNITGNTIGSNTNAASLKFTTTTSSGGVVGIRLGNATGALGAVTVSDNSVSGVEVNGSSSSVVGNFTGILALGGSTVDITNNSIGHAKLMNSIYLPTQVVSTTPQIVRGIALGNGSTTTFAVTGNRIANIRTQSLSTGAVANILVGIEYAPNSGTTTPILISQNTIQYLASSSLTTNTALGGIYVSPTAGGVANISDNKVFGLVLSGTPAVSATQLYGIYYGGSGTGNTIFNNNLHSFSVKNQNTSAIVTGIAAASGVSTYYNNVVRLGIDENGVEDKTGYHINAIYETAGTNKFYFNSTYVGGDSVNNGNSNTYAFASDVVTTARQYINNSFYNARSNDGSSGNHYAVRISGAGVNPTGLTMSNNLIFANGVGSVMGYYNGNLVDLTQLVNALGQNAGTLDFDPMYTNPIGNADQVDLAPSMGSPLMNAGIPIAGITTDMVGTPRSSSNPSIGAGETSAPLPVQLVSFTGKKNGAGILLSWTTASEMNNDYFQVQRSENGIDFKTIAKVKGKGTTSVRSTYSLMDYESIQGSTVYYRLVQVDYDRKQSLSQVVAIRLGETQASVSFSVVPNPFVSEVGLVVNSEQPTEATVRVIDMNGNQIVLKSVSLNQGMNQITLDELATASHSGMYIIQVVTPQQVYTQKALKQ